MKLGRCYVSEPFEEIKDYQSDVLIVHGTSDKIVKMEYIEKVYEVYMNRKVNKKTELYIIVGGKHMFSRKHDELAMGYVKGFLNN